jgi:hypothetical protein
MKCPACENDVPSGWSGCTWCGAPLPSAGERPGPEPHFSPGSPQAGPPRTEPLPIPTWDTGADGNVPPERHAGTDAMPPEPGPATQNPGAPVAHPRPLEHDPATWNPATPAADPIPPDHQAGWNLGAPRPELPPAGPDGPPWPDLPPAGPDPATQNLGAPWPELPPAGPDPATQNLGAPGIGPLPGSDPAGWNEGVPPLAAETPAGGGIGKSRKVPLLAGGIAAVAVLGGGLAYALTQGPSSPAHNASEGPPGAGTAAQQAAAVNKILGSGRTARGHLPSRLTTCDNVSAGVPGFQQVVQDRQQELSQSRGLKVDRLPDGARLRRTMIAAYQSSLDADQAYLAWAQEIQSRGCGARIAPLTAHYRAAISANDKAGPAKRQVVALWRPIASSHGLPTYAWNRL